MRWGSSLRFITSLNSFHLFKLVTDERLMRVVLPFETFPMGVGSIEEFPMLSNVELARIFTSYQRKIARGYIYDNLRNSNNSWKVEVMQEPSEPDYSKYGIEVINPLLLRGRCHSYHVQTEYLFFILVDVSVGGPECILEHYCTCPIGNRTANCCAHVASVITYLGCDRYNPSVQSSVSYLQKYFEEDDNIEEIINNDNIDE